MSRTIFFISVIMLGFISCNRYEDGGLMKEAEQNLQRTWTVNEYSNNDPSLSQELPFTNYSEEFKSDGAFTRTFSDDRGNSITELGRWELDQQQTGIYLVPETGIAMSGMGIYGGNYYRKIIKLTEQDFKYSFVNDSTIHTFTMSANN